MDQGLHDITELRKPSIGNQIDAGLPLTLLQKALPAFNGLLGAKVPELYYIRQVTGKVENRGAVGAFMPDFAYLFDAGFPRMPLAVVPYDVPRVRNSSGDYTTIGRGDAEFPDFSRVSMYSAQSRDVDSLLYPAPAGVLLIGVKEGVPEDEVRQQLAPYATNIVNEGHYYRVKVQPFHEPVIAAKIEKEVAAVRYAQLSFTVRDNKAPWFVSRVL